ncbi:MAG: glycosyltransferase family 9 protein, partial [Bacteroidetes bacterium]|nr:glycosyltransferase family 9 protein [Bacteroidota bacterium]
VAEIYSTLPEISNIIYFDFMKEGITKSISFINKLRKHKYDVSINVYPSNRKEYNIISFLIGAKKRLGAKYIRQDFRNLGFLNNVRVMESDDTHNVETNFKLFSAFSNNSNIAISSLKLVLNKHHLSFADSFLNEHNIKENDIVVGFHSGCSTLKNHSNRRWTPENFAELGNLLQNNFNCKILLFGAGDEIELNKKIKTIINSDDIIIVKSQFLLESISIMERCNLFVTNDSSLMHFAGALKLNTIPIIGPTNTNYIYPWQTNYKVASVNLDCSPCFFYSPTPLICHRDDIKYKCMKEITPELVFKLAKEFLN